MADLLQGGLIVFMGLLPVLVLIGVVVVIVRLASGRGQATGESAGIAVRRIFQYLLMLLALVLSCVGLSGLLSEATISAEQITRDTASVARSISFLVVGLPAFIALALYTRRRLSDDPAEVRSAGWAIYLTLVLFGSLVTSVVLLIALCGGLFVGDGLEPTVAINTVIWGTVWAVHWWIATRDGYAPDLWFEHILGSFVGLATMVSTGAFFAGAVLMETYDAVFGIPGVEPSADQIVMPLIACVIGAVVWFWYWLRTTLHDDRTVLWNAYVLLAGVLSGVLMVATGAGITIFRVLEWFVVGPSTSAADHFEILAVAVALAAVGTATWAYHRYVLDSGAERERTVVDRIYDYLLAGAGLVVTASGITTLIAYALSAITGTEIAGSDHNAIVLALTLITVGATLWGVYWARAQREHERHGSNEAQSTTRRIYVFVVLGISGVISFVSLIVLVYLLIQAVLDGTVGSSTLNDMAVPISFLTTAGAVAWYHFTVVRHDRAEVPKVVEPTVREVILVAADGEELANAIAEANIRVRKFPAAGPAEEVGSIDEVLGVLSGETHKHVVVVERAEGDGFEVIPLD